MNIYPWTEAPKKTCDQNSMPPLAIAVGNSDVRARGVYIITFDRRIPIYLVHLYTPLRIFLFLFDWNGAQLLV